MKRSEARREDTWRLEDMFARDADWEALYGETQEELGIYAGFRGKLVDSADTLFACLSFDDASSQKMERLYVYARMRSDEDTACQKYQDMFLRAQSLSVKAAQDSAFIIPEILAMPEDLLDEYMAADNGIAHFRLLLERLVKKRKHMLSGEMEAILAGVSDIAEGAGRIFNVFNNADVRFPEVDGPGGERVAITHGNYISLLESQDRHVRREAFEGLYSVYSQFSNTLAQTFALNVKQCCFYAKARRYPSSRAYSLTQNEVEETVYDNLIECVHAGLPLMHRYAALRKKLLGVDTLHMYDLYVPLVGELDRRYSFEEAKKLVLNGLTPLGEEYLSLLKEGFENRWIDVYENEGKRSGAYSWGAYGTHPYVLMNFHGKLKDVFTIAHEMGHSIHSWYSDHSQPYTYAGYKIFVAEVASTCNEVLLIKSLLKDSKDKRERAYLLNYFLESFRGTLFRQTMFAEFEYRAHRMEECGESLTAQSLCSLYHSLNEAYFGEAVKVDPEIDFEWSRIPHFYTPFYVYQYATGFSAAVSISSRILSGGGQALAGYKDFLKGGCSDTPVNLLKRAGVDMSGPAPIKEALKVFGELLDAFEENVG